MEKFNLWNTIPQPDGITPARNPIIDFYPAENGADRGAVIVFPGGGYCNLAEHEGEPIARWLNSLGINAFVLHYRISPHRHPVPVIDGLRSIRLARYKAESLGINPNKIGILGFSAGGHLAASVATLYDKQEFNPCFDEVDQQKSRPDSVVLCYPVITFCESYRHFGSATNLLGEDATSAMLESMSAERNVAAGNPPAFVWHTAEDKAVPPENSLAYVQAYMKHQLSYELHIFPEGHHGLGLSNQQYKDVCESWSRLCGVWLVKQGY